MPAIYYIIKRFLAHYQPIQKQLDEIKYSLESERLMQALASIPAEELNARLAASSVMIQSVNQTAAEFLKNVNVLLETEKTRHELQKATFEEIRKINEAITNRLKYRLKYRLK